MSEIPSFEELFSDLSHPNPNIRSQAYVSLVDNYPDLAQPRLIELLHDADPEIYRTAVKALGVLGHRALSDLLGLFKSAESGTVRACCIKALVQISVNFPDHAFPPEVIVVLEEALDDENPVVAQSALMTLGHLSKQEVERNRVIPLLIKACDRSNIAHVQGAAMALAELDSPLVDACLKSLAIDESKDQLIREVAQSSLERRKSLDFS